MSLKVSASDGVKVYHVTAGKTTPQWLSSKSHEALKRNEAYRRRIDIIQDLEFPAACHRLKLTPDGQFLVTTGIHPPRVRVYELSQLALKFERHLDAEIVDCQVLSEDYSKLAFLCTDRYLSFHAKFGAYHKTRIPFAGRALTYCPHTAELLCVGSSSSVCRLSLAEGRFQAPLAVRAPAVNACILSPACGLLSCAGEGGLLEGFDPRAPRSVGCLDAAAAMGAAGQDLTALAFEEGGLQCAVGTSEGLCAIFDLRAPKPLAIKDHMYGEPIRSVQFHQLPGESGRATRRVVSADSHSARIWDPATQAAFTTIEPASPVNDVLVWPGSGLIMAACDAPRIEAYFVPALGPAPRWSSFLENLTEEMEESAAPTLYEDYRFITRAQVAATGMSHLVGTPLLRAYMHGYFVHQRLWQKAVGLAPGTSAAAAQRSAAVAQQLEAQRASRITLLKRLPKVNAKLAERAITEDAKRQKTGDGKAAAPSLMADQRFGQLFQNPDFAVDESAEAYRLLHPNAGQGRRGKALQPQSDEESDGLDGIAANSNDEEGDGGGAVSAAISPARQRSGHQAGLSASQGADTSLQAGRRRPRQQGRGVHMYEAAAPEELAAGRSRGHRRPLRDQPLGSRITDSRPESSRSRDRQGGSKEFSFVPRGGGRGRSRGRSAGRGRGRGRS